MPVTLDVKTDEIFEFSDGKFRLARELGGRVLLLEGVSTNLQRLCSEEQLISLIAEGKVIRHEQFFDPKRRLQAANNNDEIPPDATEMQLVRARTFKFYADIWDRLHLSYGKGDVGLQRLISDHRAAARKEGYVWPVQPSRLRSVINNSGEQNNRPLRLFMSQRGKVKRSRLGQDMEGLLEKAVKFYWRRRGRDYNDAFAYFRTELRKHNDNLPSGASPLKPPKKMETLRTRINAATSHPTWAMKYSKSEADQKFNGIGNHLQAEEPGELVIMDHTVMDHWTLLDTELRIPLGRLTLTVAIDVATRCILGYLISPEAPSLYSVLTVLKRVNRPKTYMKTLYPTIDAEWDAWCHPRTLLVDNDMAFRSVSLEAAMQDIGTELKFSPIKTPEYKAIGERFFHTLNKMLLHKLPNGIMYGPETSRHVDYTPGKDERFVDIDTLDELMHRFITTVYHKRKHRGLQGIPDLVWKQKISKYRRRFISDPRKINALLGRLHIATLTRKGIEFNNHVFHDKMVTSQLLRDLVRAQPKRSQGPRTYSGGRAKVRIKWDPMDCSEIVVFNDATTPSTYVTLPNVHRKYTSGRLSYFLADTIKKAAEAQELAFSSDEERWKARDQLREAWERLIPQRKRPTKDNLRAITHLHDFKLRDDGEIVELEAKATIAGWGDPEGIRIDVNAFEPADLTEKPHRKSPNSSGNRTSRKPSTAISGDRGTAFFRKPHGSNKTGAGNVSEVVVPTEASQFGHKKYKSRYSTKE